MQHKILLSESKARLRDREIMKSVWYNQAEKGAEGRANDMLASLI